MCDRPQAQTICIQSGGEREQNVLRYTCVCVCAWLTTMAFRITMQSIFIISIYIQIYSLPFWMLSYMNWNFIAIWQMLKNRTYKRNWFHQPQQQQSNNKKDLKTMRAFNRKLSEIEPRVLGLLLLEFRNHMHTLRVCMYIPLCSFNEIPNLAKRSIHRSRRHHRRHRHLRYRVQKIRNSISNRVKQMELTVWSRYIA